MTGRAPHLLVAAGGTGGHMFPAQALAEEMLARGWRVTLSTDARGARYASGFPPQVARQVLSAASFARGGVAAKLLAPFRIAAGIVGAVVAQLRDRADVVVGFGGYPSLPALSAATFLRRPRMIHEQNGVPGKVNRLFARRVACVACGTWPTELPDGTNALHVGNPVRAAVRERVGSPYIPPGEHPMSVLVIGGSQGARILSDVVPAALALLPEAARGWLRVAHQARPEDGERAFAAYRAAGIDAEVAPFFPDIARRLSEAQLVICRAGASTLADLCAIGRPAVLVPYAAAAADHQTVNARALVQAGGAILVPEPRFDAETLAQQLETVLAHPADATRMAANAGTLGRPDAAEGLADLVEHIAAHGALPPQETRE